jgi:hypothetical protein
LEAPVSIIARYIPEDVRWDPSPAAPIDLDHAVIRHLGVADDWSPGQPPAALVRGAGHPSHVRINGWPYCYVGSTGDGNTLYETH